MIIQPIDTLDTNCIYMIEYLNIACTSMYMIEPSIDQMAGNYNLLMMAPCCEENRTGRGEGGGTRRDGGGELWQEYSLTPCVDRLCYLVFRGYIEYGSLWSRNTKLYNKDR